MPENYVQLPADSSGKKMHTRNRTIGANDVHDEFGIALEDDRVRTGIYYVATGALTVAAAADSASTGRWQLFNPVGSAFTIEIREVVFKCHGLANLATPTVPMFQLVLFTATGTISATLAAIAKRASADSTAGGKPTIGSGATAAATTGLTLTMGNALRGFLAPATNSGSSSGGIQVDFVFKPNPLDRIVLAAGEGIMLRQTTAGTASDTRVLVADFEWAEYTIP